MGRARWGGGLRGGSTGGATRQTPRIPHGIKREQRSRAPGIRPAKIAGLANLHPTLEKQRKGRLVWEETPFLTHPGAGSGRALIRTHQIRGYSKAE